MKIIRGTIFGGIFYFFLGWVVYGMLLMDYYSTGMSQALNRPEGDMVWWAMIVSNLSAALLLTLILYWSKAKGIIDGLVKGALFGFLFACMINLSFLSMTTMFSSAAVLITDLLVSAGVFALTGLVITATWGKQKS